MRLFLYCIHIHNGSYKKKVAYYYKALESLFTRFSSCTLVWQMYQFEILWKENFWRS
jgi:hypothetical protein